MNNLVRSFRILILGIMVSQPALAMHPEFNVATDLPQRRYLAMNQDQDQEVVVNQPIKKDKVRYKVSVIDQRPTFKDHFCNAFAISAGWVMGLCCGIWMVGGLAKALF